MTVRTGGSPSRFDGGGFADAEGGAGVSRAADGGEGYAGVGGLGIDGGRPRYSLGEGGGGEGRMMNKRSEWSGATVSSIPLIASPSPGERVHASSRPHSLPCFHLRLWVHPCPLTDTVINKFRAEQRLSPLSSERNWNWNWISMTELCEAFFSPPRLSSSECIPSVNTQSRT